MEIIEEILKEDLKNKNIRSYKQFKKEDHEVQGIKRQNNRKVFVVHHLGRRSYYTE